MKIKSLKIERFGVWEGLSLPKVSRGLNVFYGPNEAGKTTLMQFVRACLYGGADEDRARYIQMALDGKGRRGSVPVGGAKSGSGGPDLAEKEPSGSEKTENLSAESAGRDASRRWIGGSATVSSEFGDHRLERRYVRRDSSFQTSLERKSGFLVSEGLINWSGRFYALPGQKIAESLVVVGPDGARVGDYFAKTLTCNLDEGTYNGVFAIGLDELQRLGMLNETEAAQMLYRLSVGVDRGAFVQVFQQIVAERNDLFDVKGKPSILENLIAERDAARRKSGDAAVNLREYARLLEERRAVLDATKILRERLEKATFQKRLRELAVQIAPVWDEREAARVEIAEMGEVADVERAAVDECRTLIAVVDETNGKIKSVKENYRRLRDERDAIEIDPALDELEPRVAILEGDLPRLGEIDAEIERLEAALADQRAKLVEEETRVKSARDGKLVLTPSALDAINASLVESKLVSDARFFDANAKKDGAENRVVLPNKLTEEGLSFKEVEDFRRPARAVRRRRLKLDKTRETLEETRRRLSGLVEKLEQGLTSRRQKNLTEAIERTGALSTGLRRRVEIDRRVGEMTRYRKELERQNKMLTENQSIVGAPLYALGAAVVVGGLAFGLSLFGKLELAIGLFGLLVAIGGILYKTTVEKKNFQKLQDNQRRLGLLTKQLEQAQAEAKTFDERFPAPANQTTTFESRLQKAKADLAFFESLAPVEAQWRETTKLFRTEEENVKKAEDALKEARKRWTAWLRDACLPTSLNPTQVRDLLARVGLTEELRRQIDGLNAEIDFLRRERQGVVDRLDAALALLPRFDFGKKSPFELVPILRGKLSEHADVLQKRAELLDQMNGLKKEYRKLFDARRAQAKAVRRFLRGNGAKSERALVEAVERRETYLASVAELDAIQKRLEIGIGNVCAEDELAALLKVDETRAELPIEIENLTKRLEALDAELRGKLELSGRLSEQADALAAKKESVRTRFDAAALDLRIAEMADVWQSRAVAGRVLEDVRRAYERERQPETLREASRYLRRLTESRYVNVWTPLGEDALFVDSADGETLEVAALSRGTREQLYVAIRMALVVSFEKHGVQMPLVLDDVLVNFDNRRAASAAKLLQEFAKGGRQIFLFTCHEHICRLFLGLRVPVCVLPAANDSGRRGFRVLLPPKAKKNRPNSAESNVSVDGVRPSDEGPNFVARPIAPPIGPIVDVDAPSLERNDSDDERTKFDVKAGKNGSISQKSDEDAEKTPVKAENSRKPYLVVDGSEDPQGFRLSDDVEKLDPENKGDAWNLSVGANDFDSAPNAEFDAEVEKNANVETVDDFNDEISEKDADELDAENAGSDAVDDEKDDATPESSAEKSAELRENNVPKLAVDFSSFVFSSDGPNANAAPSQETPLESANVAPNVEYVETLKNASLAGDSVELRALSEISPTFSSTETKNNEFKVAAETTVLKDVELTVVDAATDVSFENASENVDFVSEKKGDAPQFVPTTDENDENASDGDSLDDLESIDYDEWATVFLADGETNPLAQDAETEKNESFLDYFDESDKTGENRSDDESESQEEDEYDDFDVETDEEADVDENDADFDENDDADESR